LRAVEAGRRTDNPSETRRTADGLDRPPWTPDGHLRGQRSAGLTASISPPLRCWQQAGACRKRSPRHPTATAHKRRRNDRRQGAGGEPAEGRSHVGAAVPHNCHDHGQLPACATSASSRAAFKCSSHGALRRPHATPQPSLVAKRSSAIAPDYARNRSSRMAYGWRPTMPCQRRTPRYAPCPHRH